MPRVLLYVPGYLLKAVAVEVGTRSFGLCEPFFPGCWILPPITKSRWVDKSPSRLPHKGRWSIDTAGIGPSTPFLQRGRRIEELDSLRGHELEQGGPPPSHFWESLDYQRNFQHLRSGSRQRHYLSDDYAGRSIVFDLVNSDHGCAPLFLFTIPAGFLADRLNRKKVLCAINPWLAAEP